MAMTHRVPIENGESPDDSVVPVKALNVEVPTRSAGVVWPTIHRLVMLAVA